MNLKELSKKGFDFQKERGWNIKDPNHLINSIIIELGELSEHYQWKNSFEKLTEVKKKEIAFEFVDVIVYLLSLSHRSGIEDLEPYFNKLAKKWPVGTTKQEYREKHIEYRKTGKNKTYD